MSLRLMASAWLLAAFALSQPATAQTPTLRGPWLGAGLGTASASVNCELCVGDRNGGLSGYLTGGIALSPNVRAGAEVMGWFDSTDEVRQRLLLYGASLYWTPAPASRWYLKTGLGLLNYRADDTADADDDPLGASAAALQLGGGYEFGASSRLWVTPFANMIVSTSGNLT
nr:autotransporter domain-containing protein [Gemmatimonadales bacterium]